MAHRQKSNYRVTPLRAVVVALFVFVNYGFATTYIKQNNNTTLNNSGSWGGGPPGSGDIAEWTSVSDGTGSTAALGGNVSWGGIQITNVTNWITISTGSTITLGSSGVNMSSAANSFSINCNVALNADQAWNIVSGQILAMNSAISGSHALTKSGSGTLYLNDNNTYSGQTTVSAGVLAVAKDGGVKGGVYSYGTASGTIVINNGGTVRLDTNDFMGIHTATPVATVDINSGGTMASNATFTTLNNLSLSGGTLQANGGTPTWGVFSLKGTVTVDGTVTSNISTGSGSDNNVFIGTNTAGGVTTFNVAHNTSGNDLAVSSVLTNNRDAGGAAVASGLTKSGAGTMVLSASNTYTGQTTVSAGILSIGANGSLYTGGTYAGTIVINNGGTVRLDRGDFMGVHTSTPAATFTVNSGGTLANSASYFNTLNNLTLTGGTLQSNGGNSAVWGTFALKGTVTVNGTITSNISTGSGSNNYIFIGTNVAGGTTTFNVADNGSGNDLAVSTVLADNRDPTNPYPTVASGLTKTGAGTMALSGANTYTGVTTISGGTLSAATWALGGASCNIGAATNAAGNLVFNGGTLQFTGASSQRTDRNFTINSTGGSIDASGGTGDTIGISGSSTIASGSPTLTLTGTNTSNNTLSGVLSGALTLTKSGGGKWVLSGNNTYSGGTNLSIGTLNINSATAIGAAASRLTITSGTTLDNSTAGSITLTNNNPQTWNGNFTFTGTQPLNMGAGAVTLGATPQITVSASTLTEGGAISGSYGLTKVGGGALTLTGNNTYSGSAGTSLNAGTLNINSATAIGAAAAGLTIANGTTINNSTGGSITLTNNNPQTWNGDFTFTGTQPLKMGTGAVTLGATPTITVSANTLTEGGAISGSYGLTKAGPGTLVLTNTSNAYTAATTISAGTLQLGAANVIPDGSGKGDVSLTGTLDLNSFSEGINGLTGAGIVTSGVSGAITLTIGNNNATSSFGGLIQNGSGTMSIAKAGSGTLTLSGTNTYTGVTTISGGTLSAATWALGGASSNFGAATNAAGNLVFNGGTLQFTGASSQRTDRNFTINSTGGSIDASGGTGDTIGISGSSTIASGSPAFTLTGTNIGNNTLSGVLSGALTLTKSGAGKWVLTGNNTYSGGTNLSAGTLNINSATAIGAAASRLTITGGTTIDNSTVGSITLTNNNPQTWNGNFTFTGTQALNMGAGAVTLGATPTITVSANTLTEGGAISGSYGLTKAGPGTLVLTNTSNAYTAATTISAGTLQLGAANVIPDGSGKGDVSLTGTLDLNSFSEGINGISGAGTVTSGVSGAVALTIGNNDATSSFGGLIQNGSGSMSITKTGAGTLTLSNSNTYTGVTTINGGVISVATLANGGAASNIGQAANTADKIVINGGTLSYTGGAISCDRLFTVGASGATIDASGSGALNLSNAGSVAYSGSATHLITLAGTNTGANTLAAVIGNDGSNAVSLTKSGAGEWVLSGNNTYTGTVSVSAGTLLVNGSCTGAGGAVTVSGGATLGGTGTVTGPVTVNSGATLSPGSAGTGILTFSNNLTLASGATYAVEINGATAGSSYDQAAVTGTITLGAALSLTLGYTPTIGDAYTIIANNGSNAVGNTFLNIAEGGTIDAVYGVQVGTFTVSYLGGAGHDVVLTCNSVNGLPVDDYMQWHYSKKVYINTKEGGANIKSNQSNFPLLVRLTSANFNFSQAQSLGQDVRFSKSTGVHFPYQIERWDNVSDLAEIWVNVDVIKGYNDSQYVWMYWGKSNAVDSSKSTAVFDTANSFVAAYHFPVSSDTFGDATYNVNTGTNSGSTPNASSIIGYGRSFVRASSQKITAADANVLDLTGTITLSAWINPTSIDTADIIGKDSTAYDLEIIPTKYLRFGSNKTFYLSSAASAISTGSWYHVAATYNSTGNPILFYVNGAQLGTSVTGAAPVATATTLYIGARASGKYFNGGMDEPRVEKACRSADWIKLCYETQRADQTTVTVQENYSDWTYSQNLYLNTKASGANVANNVIKFPMLVRLNTTNFDFTAAQSSGQDIRFAKSDGTHLYYETEKWNSVSDSATLWVRVDTVFGNDSTHYITMYWGNNLVNSMSNGKAVFDTGNGFAGVWHFGPTVGATDTLRDATVNGFTLTNVSSTPTTGTMIALGRTFNGSSQRCYASDAAGLEQTGNLTLSAWINHAALPTAGGTAMGLLSKATAEYRFTDSTIIGGNNYLYMTVGGTRYTSTAVTAFATGTWYHAVASLDAAHDTLLFYTNGAKLGTTITSATGVPATGSNAFNLGDDQSSNWFNGSMDEARLEKVYRNPDWIKLCYENQKPSQTLGMFTNEDYSQWAYSRKVTLNTTPSGANVAATQFLFPTLIRLTSANFPFAQAQDDGRDIRFASSLGKHLPYEIERWDRSNQLAEIWVLADSITGNNGTQYMTMYWGKTGVVSRSSGTAVFDPSNNFAGVWHLNNSLNNTTSNSGIDGTDNNSTNTTGIIGYGRNFALAGPQDFSVAYSAALNLSTYTVSAWTDLASVADLRGIIGTRFGSENTFDLKWMSTSLHGDIGSGSTWLSTAADYTYTPVASTWYHVAYVVTANSYKIYLNGAEVVGNGSFTGTPQFMKSGETMHIGNSSATEYFDGVIDEPRVENTNHSANWIKLCYENQKTNQTLVDLENYSQWAYSKKIYINTSGMGLNNYVVNFPLLVRLDATKMNFSQAQASGQDIRFSKADGTHFRYEKEQWDTTNKKAALWVLVDTVFQNNATQYIKMYWGKSDAVDNSNSNAVFDTANGFAGVWHFSPESGTDTLRDATINGFTLTNVNTMPITTLPIALGRTLNGSNQRCYANDATALKQTGNLTLSAWINHAALPATTTAMGMVSKNTAEYRFADTTYSSNNYLSMHVGGTLYTSTAATGFATGTWYHAAASLDAAHDTLLFYTNGAKLGNTITSATGAPASGTNALNVGDDQSSNWFNGSMDEVRLEKVFRNPDWINLCYNTQNPTQTATQTDTSSELFSSLGMTTTYTSGQLTAATIAAHNWTIKFDATNSGGGIYWLSPDSVGAAANQLDGNSDLFTLITDNDSTSKGAATLTMLDSSNVFARLLQQRTIGALTYYILYTVQGNGKVFIRVYTYSTAAVTPAGGLEFRIATGGASNITNYYPTATATNCNYLLHCDAASNRLDPCLALFTTWSQATAITGTASGKYIGMISSSWTMPGNRSRVWEFMLDLAHRNWNDSTGVGAYISEYSNPDSLAFYTGTPYLEKAWEDQLSGHWKFEEGSGDTAFDNSGGSNSGVRTTGSTWTWTSGKWGGGLSLSTGDSVKVVDNAAFNGGTSGFTIMAWVKPTAALTSSSRIFGKFGTNGYKMTGGGGDVVQLTLNGTTFSDRTDIGSGSWHHVAVMYHKRTAPVPDTVKLFVDGKTDTIITGTYSFDASGVNALMGPGFAGTLDDVRFYNECLSDDAIKTVYQLGYAASQGMYMVRADNNNAINCVMHGAAYHRYFPVFQVTNFWNSAALGANNPYVYLNGTQLAYNRDYFVMLDQNIRRLTVGFNRAMSGDAQIYIGSDPVQAVATNAMPQMSWGKYAWPSSHFYVKNFSGNTFGGAAANQYYMDFKMDNTVAGNGGEIYRLKTSMISPCGTADTTSTGNLVSASSSTDSASFSSVKFKIGTHWLKSTANIAAAPTYTVVESSAVRVILQIDDRKLKNSTDSCTLRTWFTLYPTGQIFRWDSVYVPNASINIDTVRLDVLEKYAGSGAGTGYPSSITNAKLYGGIYGATSIQDYATALLVLDTLNGAAYGAEAPSVKDTARAYSNGSGAYQGIGTRFVHCSRLLNANKPYQTALYMDVHCATFTSALIESVRKGVQNNINSYTGRLLINGTGDTVLGSAGDFNLDGFNEREGAYIYAADNANTAHFTLTANGDTCRFYPAFRITKYTATNVPQYVFVNSQALVRGFGYNAYLKQATRELILQINQTICSNADIYISSDRTLAVTMDDFRADPGDGRVKLQWNTESEENNLGFFLYRRIRPQFLDSISRLHDTASAADTAFSPGAASLMKNKAIGFGDTAWRQVNEKIIYGATAGVSYGQRKYSLMDRQVFNDVNYEYKLVAVDYNSSRETYDKYASAMPRRVIPLRFALWGNFPNPFRRLTCLKYDLPVRTKVMINIYDIQGRLVRRLVRPDKPINPGFYQALWDCRDDRGKFLASGPYIYRITAQGFAMARVMVMIR
jgi:autotransporter-associated beta strand protein